MAGVMHNIGVLKDGKATQEFYDFTIRRLKKNYPDAVPSDIEDKEKYPGFHNRILPQYESISKSLDVQGQFSLPPPIMDPFALTAKFNTPDVAANLSFDIGKLPTLNPGELAFMIDIPLAKFAAEVPTLVQPPPTSISQIFPNLPVPEVDLGINLPPPSKFCSWFKFESWPLSLPNLFFSALGKLATPTAIFDLCKPQINVDGIVQAAIDAQLFGPSDPGENFKIAVAKDMAEYTAHSVVVGVVAKTIGDGGQKGLTGKVANDLQVFEVPREKVEEGGLSIIRRKFLENVDNFMGRFDQETFDIIGKCGFQSIGAKGAGKNPKVISPGYPVTGKLPAKKGKFGTIITSCGELPGTIFNDFIRANPGEYGHIDTRNEFLGSGPAAVMVVAKYMRAWVPASAGKLPKPGDIYILQMKVPNDYKISPEEGSIQHVGLIYDVKPSPGEPGIYILRTAEAGYGDSDEQKSVWNSHKFNAITGRMDGSAGTVDQFQKGGESPSGSKVAGWLDLETFINNISQKKYPIAFEKARLAPNGVFNDGGSVYISYLLAPEDDPNYEFRKGTGRDLADTP